MENKEIYFDSLNPVEEELLHQNLITENQYNFVKKLQKASAMKKETNTIALYDKAVVQGGKTKSQVEDNADFNNPFYHLVNIFGGKNIETLNTFFCCNRSMKSIECINNLYEILENIFKILDNIENYYCLDDYERLIYRLSNLVKKTSKNFVKKRLKITQHKTFIKVLSGRKDYQYYIYENILKLLKI